MISTDPSHLSTSRQCHVCLKPITEKKSTECTDCSQVFCKDHIKVNETDYSSRCAQCFKAKIHLEVSLELENEMVESKVQLNTFKEKLKNCKKDLSNKTSTIERLENQAKIAEKTHQRKLETLEKNIEDEKNRAGNLFNTCENLKSELDQRTDNQKSMESELKELKSELAEVQSELKDVKDVNNEIANKIRAGKLENENYISYTKLKEVLCNICKIKIRSSLRDEIISSNKGHDSLIASVLAQKNRMSGPISNNKKEGELDDSCKCNIA
jgi:chromosome segregation ATPase